MNAFNLIDGIDGLAGGIGFLGHISFAIYFYFINDIFGFAWSFIVSGGLLAFLFYNKPKAKIFMGDTGSLFIGFSLSTLIFFGGKPMSHQFILVFSSFMFIPIMDTTAAILRRLMARKHILKPDMKHTHHKLLYLGFSVKYILIMSYLITILLNLATLIVSINNYSNWFYLIAWIIGILIFWALHVAFYKKEKKY